MIIGKKSSSVKIYKGSQSMDRGAKPFGDAMRSFGASFRFLTDGGANAV